MPSRTLATSLFTMVFLFGVLGPVKGAPDADLWERWTAYDPQATATIDHRVWDRFLRNTLRTSPGDVSRINYGAVSSATTRELDGYLARMSAVQISRYNRQEQLAYWLNLYNALTVKVVLDHYPVESIMDIGTSPGLFTVGPWGEKLVSVEGQMLSLDDIEHRIVRPIWRDARIHYAVNCAAYGCPNLAERAFSGDSVDEMLDAAARGYVNSDRAVRIQDGNLYVSSVYAWYKDDFGGTDAGVIAHLRGFAEPGLDARLAGKSDIQDDFYDWALNDSLAEVESESAGNGQVGRAKLERGSTAR